MRKTKIKQCIYAILIIIWMTTIFNFSSQESQESSSTSERVIRASIGRTQTFKKLDENSQKQLIENCQYPIRKLAHFSIYAIGGILIFNFVNTYSIGIKRKIIYTILIGGAYAITDEIHQLFIDGRSGQITDVLIDTAGVATGCIVKHLVHK